MHLFKGLLRCVHCCTVQNFGVDYLAFSELCPTCPPDYLKLAFTCVSIEPSTRPKTNELVRQGCVAMLSHSYSRTYCTYLIPTVCISIGTKVQYKTTQCLPVLVQFEFLSYFFFFSQLSWVAPVGSVPTYGTYLFVYFMEDECLSELL